MASHVTAPRSQQRAYVVRGNVDVDDLSALFFDENQTLGQGMAAKYRSIYMPRLLVALGASEAWFEQWASVEPSEEEIAALRGLVSLSPTVIDLAHGKATEENQERSVQKLCRASAQ